MILAAVAHCGSALQFIPKELAKDRELILAAEIVLSAIAQNTEAMESSKLTNKQWLEIAQGYTKSIPTNSVIGEGKARDGDLAQGEQRQI